jgi:hypothetical protein
METMKRHPDVSGNDIPTKGRWKRDIGNGLYEDCGNPWVGVVFSILVLLAVLFIVVTI